MEYETADSITAEEYMELRKIVGWGLYPLEQAVDGLKNTTHIYALKKDGKTIALLRILWDHGYVVYIADVIVRPEFQGQGLGRKLMTHAMEYIRGLLKQGWRVMVSLMAAKGKEEFYKKFGFFTRPDEEHGCGMSQWIEKGEGNV